MNNLRCQRRGRRSGSNRIDNLLGGSEATRRIVALRTESIWLNWSPRVRLLGLTHWLEGLGQEKGSAKNESMEYAQRTYARALSNHASMQSSPKVIWVPMTSASSLHPAYSSTGISRASFRIASISFRFSLLSTSRTSIPEMTNLRPGMKRS